MVRVLACLALVIGVAACKHDAHFTDAAPPSDGRPIDGGVVVPDGAPPAPGREVTTGGGRVSSQSYVLDVQVGHSVSQKPASSASIHVEGNAPVKP